MSAPPTATATDTRAIIDRCALKIRSNHTTDPRERTLLDRRAIAAALADLAQHCTLGVGFELTQLARELYRRDHA